MKDQINSAAEIRIHQLLELLVSSDGMERRKAREELVDIGEDVVELLIELEKNPKHLHRWEALKTLCDIGSEESIHVFIKALEDDESDIRWLAAEGLINLEKKSIKPLLHAIEREPDSSFLLSGAHHVFYDLKKAGALPPEFPINTVLEALKSSDFERIFEPVNFELIEDSIK